MDAHVSRIVAVVRWEVIFIELSVITGNKSQIPDNTQIPNSLKFCDTNSISELPDFTDNWNKWKLYSEQVTLRLKCTALQCNVYLSKWVKGVSKTGSKRYIKHLGDK